MYLKEYSKKIIKKRNGRKGSDYFLFGWRFLHINKKKSKELIQNSNTLLKNYFSPQDFPSAVGLLRDIQLSNIEILKEIDKICTTQKLEYWLFFGSLLGAVRHQGYIPWDDDIDIGMMREDYEKFIKIFNSNSTDFFAEYYCNKQWNLIKVKHKKIPSIFIDIFPFDLFHKTIPTLSEKNELSEGIKIIRKEYLLKSKNLSIQNKLSLLKELTYEKILKNNIGLRENKPAIFLGLDFEWLQSTIFFNYEDIFPLSKTRFEDHLFSIPNHSDFVLTYLYRDYMHLPKKLEVKHTEIEKIPIEEIIEIKKFLKERTK